MAALSKVEASTTGLGEEKDSEPFKCFNAGANAMAEALLDEADAETVREKKTQAIYEIVLDELFKMAKKGIEREMGI